MIMHTTAPSSLLFGLARLGPDPDQLAWLGITLQHPPIAIDAQPAPVLSVTGARADLARAQAERVLARLNLPPGNLEIEMGIPRYLGLGSDPLTGLAVARTLAALAGHPGTEDTFALAGALDLTANDALAVHGFDHGGMLLVPAEPEAGRWPAPLRWRNMEHDDEHAWVWVLHWPDTPPGTSPTLEADRMDALLAAAPHLSAETGRLVFEELWPALERDDMAAFGQALMAFQQLNRGALEAAGTPPASAPSTAGVLEIMRDNGAAAWGESAAGLAPFGLIRGALASVRLRRQVVGHVGYEGGTVMAAIGNNRGATVKVDEEQA